MSVACNTLGSHVFLGHDNGTVGVVSLLPHPPAGDIEVSGAFFFFFFLNRKLPLITMYFHFYNLMLFCQTMKYSMFKKSITARITGLLI